MNHPSPLRHGPSRSSRKMLPLRHPKRLGPSTGEFHRGAHVTGRILSFATELGKFHHDLTVLPHWNHGLDKGKSSPFMALLFRLVKYYNLPR